jgi:hypothetical protein
MSALVVKPKSARRRGIGTIMIVSAIGIKRGGQTVVGIDLARGTDMVTGIKETIEKTATGTGVDRVMYLVDQNTSSSLNGYI